MSESVGSIASFLDADTAILNAYIYTHIFTKYNEIYYCVTKYKRKIDV